MASFGPRMTAPRADWRSRSPNARSAPAASDWTSTWRRCRSPMTPGRLVADRRAVFGIGITSGCVGAAAAAACAARPRPRRRRAGERNRHDRRQQNSDVGRRPAGDRRRGPARGSDLGHRAGKTFQAASCVVMSKWGGNTVTKRRTKHEGVQPQPSARRAASTGRRAGARRQIKRRVRRLRHLRPSRGGQPHLPRPLRAAASRAGERRHRGVRRRARPPVEVDGLRRTRRFQKRRWRSCRAAWRSATSAIPPPATAAWTTRSPF